MTLTAALRAGAPMRKSLERIIKADCAKTRAQKSLARAVKMAYPVGSIVYWEHGSKEISARVVDHSDSYWVSPDLFVEGFTGKRYRVCAQRVWDYERKTVAHGGG